MQHRALALSSGDLPLLAGSVASPGGMPSPRPRRPVTGRGGAPAEVTVGIPTYNRSQLLKRSIASVLRQSYRGFKLIVSDNASDDDTASVVASFRDPRLVYRPLERNIGRAANFNRLIDLAETEFVVLMGDDDQLHPEHLSLHGRGAQALPDRRAGAHRLHDRRPLGRTTRLAPSLHRDPAPVPGGIRGAVPRAEHEVGLDGLLLRRPPSAGRP